jgi:hypothetical protein
MNTHPDKMQAVVAAIGTAADDMTVELTHDVVMDSVMNTVTYKRELILEYDAGCYMEKHLAQALELGLVQRNGRFIIEPTMLGRALHSYIESGNLHDFEG